MRSVKFCVVRGCKVEKFRVLGVQQGLGLAEQDWCLRA